MSTIRMRLYLLITLALLVLVINALAVATGNLRFPLAGCDCTAVKVSHRPAVASLSHQLM